MAVTAEEFHELTALLRDSIAASERAVKTATESLGPSQAKFDALLNRVDTMAEKVDRLDLAVNDPEKGFVIRFDRIERADGLTRGEVEKIAAEAAALAVSKATSVEVRDLMKPLGAILGALVALGTFAFGVYQAWRAGQ